MGCHGLFLALVHLSGQAPSSSLQKDVSLFTFTRIETTLLEFLALVSLSVAPPTMGRGGLLTHMTIRYVAAHHES